MLAFIRPGVVTLEATLLFYLKMDFKMDINKKIILQVQRYECLYNYNVQEYKSITKRNAAWRQIALDLNINADLAKETWEKLRRCFCNARNRRMSKVNPYRKPWKYEVEMDFLLPYSEIRGSQLTTDDKKNVKEIDNPTIGIPIKHEHHSTDDEIDEIVMCEEIAQQDFPAYYSEDLSEDFNPATSNSKSTLLENDPTSTQYILNNFDETELFFLSMARMVKQLPKREQSSIKMEISNLVFKAEQKFN